MNEQKLSDLVNQSGFPLQLGVAHHVQETSNSHGWKVLFTEHAWRHVASNSDGFIDIVLEDKSGSLVMVVECKRVLESSWIFLNADPNARSRRHAKAWTTCYISRTQASFGWNDVTLEPSCPQSQYCVVPGQDAKSKPMLERVGAELVLATQALAEEENPYHARRGDSVRMYFSVIVTTADLKLCPLDPANISLIDGKVSGQSFIDAPYIRFRKQLSTQPLPPDFSNGLSQLVRAKEHTVFVVNARALARFLEAFDIDDSVFRQLSHRTQHVPADVPAAAERGR